MHLVSVHPDYQAAFCTGLDEMRAQGELHFWEDVGNPESVADYIAIRTDHAEGRNLPDGWVPCSAFWLMDEGEFIGEVNIRHELSEWLRNVGGHIGYWIRPSKRQQGYGTAILRLALQEAKKLGIDRVLLTCDKTNEPSRKIIEVNGGVYEREQDMGPELPPKLLFWIENS